MTPPSRTIDDGVAAELAELLHGALLTGQPIPALTESRPTLTLADGYAVQQGVVARLLDAGDRVIGYKLGLTSAPMQQLLGVDSPDLAPVFVSHLNPDGAAIPAARFIAPRIEAEIAFVLGGDLSGPDCTPAQVLAATSGVSTALEIVDSRIADWKIKLADTVADLASCGAIVLSGQVVPLDFDIRLAGMVLTCNGELIATAAGAAALGNPAAAIAFLVQTLHGFGENLLAGQVVMTGALHAAVPIHPGQVYRAEIDRLGPVTVRIT